MRDFQRKYKNVAADPVPD